jgi:hypothetical protein
MDFDESSGPSAAQAATDQPQRKRMRVKRERILYRNGKWEVVTVRLMGPVALSGAVGPRSRGEDCSAALFEILLLIRGKTVVVSQDEISYSSYCP